MLRLSLAAAGLLATVAPLHAAEAPQTGTGQVAKTSIKDATRDLYVWGYPLVQAARIRLVSTPDGPPNSARLSAPIHHFAHGRALAGPQTKIGVGPNNDTLYSLIWMDLAHGPYVFEAPDFGDRYYTFSLNAADSSSSDSLGRRTHGRQLPPMFIHGPGYTGPIPEGMVEVTSPTRYFELAGRTLTTGTPEDYAAVHRLQDAMKLRRIADWQQGRDVPAPVVPQRPLDDPGCEVAPDLRFLEELGQVLRDWLPRPMDETYLRMAARLGIGPDGFDPMRLKAPAKAEVARGIQAGKALVERQSRTLGVQVNGWTTNYSGARFGEDYLLRAGVAKDQIYVAVPEEAIYPIGRVDSDGQALNGSNDYRIAMPANALPPVDAFWSITLYGDDGFMVPNPINRYSVGDRTKDLVRQADGSVVIAMSAKRPKASDVNWLPAPQGPFYLMMRLYQPQAAALNRIWSPPSIVRLNKQDEK